MKRISKKTRKEILEKIERSGITEDDDYRIEFIANRFPEMYKNEQEYVELQVFIGELVNKHNRN